MIDKHPNSKIITIFRAGSYLARAQGKEIQDFFAEASVSIGSFWESSTSTKVATGLTHTEEELLLPGIIDAEPTDRDFRKKVSDYFTELDIKVPHKGRQMEIGLDLDNNKPVSKTNWPLSLSDYIQYRLARTHPKMAPTSEAAEASPIYDYYIFDKEASVNKNLNKTKEKDDALKLFYSIEDSPIKIREMLLLMGKDPREFSGKDADRLQKDHLRNLTETKPALFISTFKLEDLSTRYWITAMVRSGVLEQIGARIRVKNAAKTILGNNMEEAIVFFQDVDTNEDMITSLKAQQQEKDKELPGKVPLRTKLLNEL